MPLKLTLTEATGGALACAAIGYVADDWLAAFSVFVLLVGIKLVSTGDGVFALPFALAFHWSQTSVGLFYHAFFGRELQAINSSNWRPMMIMALFCVAAVAVGIHLGLKTVAPSKREAHRDLVIAFPTLVAAYIVSVFFEGTLSTVAVDYPSVRQMIVTVDVGRLGLLFLLLRRLLRPVPRWGLFAGIVSIEVVLGITGFFAGFREPLILGAIAVFEIFDRRSARHWFVLTLGAAAAIALGIVWMGVRGEYRHEYSDFDTLQTSRSRRIERIGTLSSEFFSTEGSVKWSATDAFVDRMWTIYYPALALERVPTAVGHTDGGILRAAILHIVTPRVFFPDKPGLMSDSEKVRTYAGVMVAGDEQNTSIAFGYSAESYVDFGSPLMFVPVFVFGVALGASYALFRRLLRHQELFVAFATVTFWLSLYLFERSWATMLGSWVGLLVYLGLPLVVIDSLLLVRTVRRDEARASVPFSELGR